MSLIVAAALAVMNTRAMIWKVRMDQFEDALEYTRRSLVYNDYDPERVVAGLQELDEAVPRAENGTRIFTVTVGREYSPVLYVDVNAHGSPIVEPGNLIRAALEGIGQRMIADENHEEWPEHASGWHLTWRWWWD